MKINNYTAKQNTTSFKSLATNKLLLTGLEKISEHGTTFVAGTSFLMAVGVRPAVIAMTPGVDKENKQYSLTNSIASGLIKFLMVEAIALPIENAVKKIDKNPENYLKPETITKLKGAAESLSEAKGYNLATQILKLGSGLVTTIPKSMLTIALIPVIMDILFKNKKNNGEGDKARIDKSNPVSNTNSGSLPANASQSRVCQEHSLVFNLVPQSAAGSSPPSYSSPFQNTTPKFSLTPTAYRENFLGQHCTLEREPEIFNDIQNRRDALSPSFKSAITETTAKGIGKILNNKTFQNFVTSPNISASNVARNMSMATDVLLTSSFVYRTSKSKKIKEERKKPLIYNNIISTGISLLGGYSIDKIIQKSTQNSIKKFAELHKDNPKLPKYINGINILRPTLIFAAVYYGVLPVFTTFMADKIDKLVNKPDSKQEE